MLKLLIFYLLDMWGFWEMGPGFPSFPVSWFLLVFIGFWGSETSRNQNAGLLMDDADEDALGPEDGDDEDDDDLGYADL